jgi:predicted deacylase
MPPLSIPNEYPVELAPPDISPYRQGNVGIDYVTRFESGRAGPHVLVTAIVHGNELCGALALDWAFKAGLRPALGALTFAFCNVAAFTAFDPADANASRWVDEDFNRVWSPERLDGAEESTELRRARELRPVVDAADFLLDIHSMQTKVPALTISGPLDKGRRLARAVGVPAIVVSDAGHSAGRRMRDYGGFGDPASAKNALLVECGQHWERASETMAKETLLRFLVAVGALDRAGAERFLPLPPPPPQRLIEVTHAVTIESDEFRFAAPYVGLECIAKAGTVLGHDGGRPVTTPYDDCVLIMPSRRLMKGQTAVRLGRYVG